MKRCLVLMFVIFLAVFIIGAFSAMHIYAVEFLEAAFSADPTEGSAPLSVNFNDNSSGPPTGWAWYFGDENYDNDWEYLADDVFEPRLEQSTVVMSDGSIIMTGGRLSGSMNDELTTYKDVYRSDDGGVTWTVVTVTGEDEWEARYGHSMVVRSDDSIILMGGRHGEPFASNNWSLYDVWVSADGGLTWTEKHPDPQGGSEVNWGGNSGGRTGHSSVVLSDDTVLMIGGFTSHIETMKNEVWKLHHYQTVDTTHWEWEEVTADNEPDWDGRKLHSCVVLSDDTIVLMGGRTYETPRQRNDVWRSADQGSTWTRVTENADWSGRYGHTSVVLPDDSIILMGGWDGDSRLNDVWHSTDGGENWTEVTEEAEWAARRYASSVVLHDGSIILIAGESDDRELFDVWSLETAGSNIEDPTHTYAEGGTYDVALQVFNDQGLDRITKAGFITVYESADLTDLTISNIVLDPQFTPDRTNYKTGVAYDVESVDVIAYLFDPDANMLINDEPTADGVVKEVVLNPAGEHTMITIIVTAVDSTEKTYSIYIDRPLPGSDADLSALSVNPGTLDPVFEPGTTEYAYSGRIRPVIPVTPGH